MGSRMKRFRRALQAGGRRFEPASAHQAKAQVTGVRVWASNPAAAPRNGFMPHL
jgi:hypothetical protein